MPFSLPDPMAKNSDLWKGIDLAIGITVPEDYLPHSTFFPILLNVHLLESLSADIRMSDSNFCLSAFGIRKVSAQLSASFF